MLETADLSGRIAPGANLGSQAVRHPGHHDNPFGIRLSSLMIGKRIPDSSMRMSLLADHPNVRFNYYRGGLGTVDVEMH